MRTDFSIFIISHGRAENIATLDLLQNLGYKGNIKVIIDNKDKQRNLYKKRCGKNLIIFDKDKYINSLNTPDLNTEHRGAVFARNACFDIARKLGFKYFLVLDDDYKLFRYRCFRNGTMMSYNLKNAKQFEKIIDLYLEFLENSKAQTVCFAQAGDYIGGNGSAVVKDGIRRKAMNSFFLSTERPFEFVGRSNEDVNTYVNLGNKGQLFFTIGGLMLDQCPTQSQKGGMTELYLAEGTYTKSFYSVIFCPSAVIVNQMQGDNCYGRMHHKVSWNNCVPCIISEKYKKK